MGVTKFENSLIFGPSCSVYCAVLSYTGWPS